jgi:hypothetical protein
MLRSRLALLMILLAAPAHAGGRSGGGFHGGGFHGGFHGGGFHGGRLFAFHRRFGRAHVFFGGFGYGYNCGFASDCGLYDGNAYGGGYGGNGYSGVYDGNGYGGSGGFSGYASDPVGAEIPPLIIPTNCWVRRPAYDPSGASIGQALINLCRPSDDVTVTGLKARAKTPETGTGTGQPAPLDRSGAPQSGP